tara:strand:- start:3636 stop:3827 length:192 start_codon:yes stop_codon:yes gene_type:complete
LSKENFSTYFNTKLILKKHIMAKSSGLKNAPSTTGRPSGKGRNNNPSKISGGNTSTNKGTSKK